MKNRILSSIANRNKRLVNIRKCEVCSSKKIEPFINNGRIGSNYKYGTLPICICNECGYKFLSPRKNNKFYIEYYKKFYRSKKKNNVQISNLYEKSQISRGQKIFDFFKKKIKVKRKFFLDHGCAMGLTMMPWRDNGWNVTGLDPNIESVNYAKEKYSLKIIKSFGENLSNQKNKYNIVLSLGSLEHSFDLNKTMQKIKYNTSDDAYLIIRWRSNKLIGSPLEYYNHNHFRYFNRFSWKILLNKFGFSKISFYTESIEQNNGYEYILAKKTGIASSIKKFKKELKSLKKGKTEKNYFRNYFLQYTNLSKKIKKLQTKKNLNNYNSKVNFINKYKIGLINHKKDKKSVDRFFVETKRFLRFKYQDENR